MELRSDDDSDKDAAMKRSFESVTDTSESSKDKKKAPKKSLFAPVEKVEETKHETRHDEEDGTAELPKSIFRELLQVEDTAESEEQGEQQLPIDKLDEDEKTAAVEAVVESNLVDAQQERAEQDTGTAEAAEVAASIQFLEAMKAKLGDQEPITESVIDEVTQEVIEEITADDDLTLESDVSIDEVVIEASDDDDDELTHDNSPPAPPVSSATPTQPPVSSSRSGFPPPPSLPGSGSDFVTEGEYEPAADTVVPPQNTNEEVFVERRSRAGDLLLGGVVGYMIGRRRGRINTEKKLLPVQEKLEKEVKELQRTIVHKELEVRRAARVQFEKQQIPDKKIEKESQPPKQETEQAKPKDVPETSRPIAKEDIHLPEQGAVRGEQTKEDRDTTLEHEKTKEIKLPKRTVETMSLPLLLEVASGLQIEQVSLRNLYEQGVVDQKRLREIVKRYMRGESLETIWPDALSEDIIGAEQKNEQQTEKHGDSSGASRNVGSQQDAQVAVNTAVPSYYNDQSNQVSPLMQTIIQEIESEKNVKQTSIPPAILMIFAVIVAILIITIFT